MKIELFSEIITSLKRNKLRTFLTGFSIAWGIFMLIVLLAAGNGLKNGVTSNFSSSTLNTLQLFASRTSMPYNGYPKGRKITMNNSDSIFMAYSFPEVGEVIPVYPLGYKTIYNQKKYASGEITAVLPEYFAMKAIDIEYGRPINNLDMKEKRKVIVLCRKDAELLFGTPTPVNQVVVVDNIVYQVIGVYANERFGWRTESFIPLTSAQSIYNTADHIDRIVCTLNGLTTEAENDSFNLKLQQRLSVKHKYHPDDNQAIFIWNSLRDYLQTIKIFSVISIFVWVIGVGTLIAGIVGVSNIMLITVRERTKEFGIRKALGAKPSAIIRLIIAESLLVTAAFGYVGMFFGILLTEIINTIMANGATATEGNTPVIFQNPTVDISIALAATFVLVVAGVLAGYFPARKAVAIKPIEALKYE
jgi:putative ABC transport system permease protein